MTIQKTLAKMLAAAHVRPVLHPRIQSAAYRTAVESGQFTREEARLLSRLGGSGAFVADFISSEANTPIPARIDMSTVIANSAMITALRQEAAMLRAEARNVPL